MLPNMCRLCSYLDGPPFEFSAINDRNSHAQVHLFQLGYFFDCNQPDFQQVFDQCFPPQQEIETNSDAENERRRSILLKRCFRAFYHRNNNSDPLICRECGKSVRYTKGSEFDTYSILQHACSHLDTKLYGCRHCNYGAHWHSNIRSHIKLVHKIISPSTNKDILERWAVDFDAIVAILNKCYDGFDQDSKKTSQEQLIERQRLCIELVKKYATIDRKIECQLCRKAILVQDKYKADNTLAIQHIRMHLKKAIFKCSKCSASYTSRTGAHKHAKHQHNSSFTETIEDQSDKYHAEIMDLLTKCYEKKTSL